jgi:hypothetical protein
MIDTNNNFFTSTGSDRRFSIKETACPAKSHLVRVPMATDELDSLNPDLIVIAPLEIGQLSTLLLLPLENVRGELPIYPFQLNHHNSRWH